MELTLRIASEARVGVVIASSSGRHSEVFRWDLEAGTFEPGQFLKAHASALSVSSDGRYFGYEATAYHKRDQTYLGVAHVPYFTALAFFPTHPNVTRDLRFVNGSIEAAMYREHLSFIPGYETVRERVEAGCPFRILKSGSCSAPPNFQVDPVSGQRFFCDGDSIFEVREDGQERQLVRKFERRRFRTIEPPEWALRW